jgi:alkanesulfonate monooxygenase SsuD/methylene tetrahydromethanopterin reductase-like flavin-dependent oxidoreductase (luciferase family)
MGRTTPTYRSYLDGYEAEWQPFRRTLRRSDRAAFDRVFEKARRHADAAGQRDPPDPRFAVLFSVLVAQERELAALRAAVEGIEGPAEGPHATTEPSSE